MDTSSLTLGTFGNGCVGQGFLELLNANGGTAAQVKHVCVKDRTRVRDVGNALLTYEALDILGDDQVRAIVELTNDPLLALRVIVQALNTGRHAITASKRVVADNLAELIALQRATGRSLLYEASCAASIPVLHTLETHFSGEEVVAIEGILNGTTNYILTKSGEEGLAPAEALKAAQLAGFAERDPSSDLSGDDSRYKLTILLAHAFGTVVRPREILRHGIEGLQRIDLDHARSNGWTVRLLARARRTASGICAYVLPAFVPPDDPFAFVRNEYNAVRITGRNSGVHVLQGKGAGKLPTGLAVLGDVQRLLREQGYTYGKVRPDAPELRNAGNTIEVYARIPATHQEVLARFHSVRPLDGDRDQVRVTGTIDLEELGWLLGEGRDGFQVIALPHLRAAIANGGE